MKLISSLLIVSAIATFGDAKEIKRILFLGLDGAGSFHTEINTPTINKLLKSGTYTNRALAMDPTWSGQNWGSMFTGVVPSKHKLNNSVVAAKPYPEDSPYPTVFKIIHQHDPSAKMASFSMWRPINTGIIELSVPMHRLDKPTDDEIFGDMLNYLRNNATDTKLMFYYFGDIDETGHHHGWMGKEYKARYTKTDGYIKQILDTLEKADLADSTMIVITADHGGIKKSHGGTTKQERNILFGVSGPNIKRKELADHSVRNMDVAAIILKSLNISIPSYFDAKLPQL